jgi:hypothetical protein
VDFGGCVLGEEAKKIPGTNSWYWGMIVIKSYEVDMYVYIDIYINTVKTGEKQGK